MDSHHKKLVTIKDSYCTELGNKTNRTARLDTVQATNGMMRNYTVFTSMKIWSGCPVLFIYFLFFLMYQTGEEGRYTLEMLCYTYLIAVTV